MLRGFRGLDVHVSAGGEVGHVIGVVAASAGGMLEVLDRADELSMLDACVVMMKTSMAWNLAWGTLARGAIARSAGGAIKQVAARGRTTGGSSVSPSWGRINGPPSHTALARRLGGAIGAPATLADGGVHQKAEQLVQSLLALARAILRGLGVKPEAGGWTLATLAWDEDRSVGAESARLRRAGGVGGHDRWERSQMSAHECSCV